MLILFSVHEVVIRFRCSAVTSSHLPAFIAILHSAMTNSVPHTLHHRAHAHHQRHLLSTSASEERTSAALDNIRASIGQECSTPLFYIGCSAAQCVCLSASNMTVLSLLPTNPLSTSKTSINISSIASIRFINSPLSFSLDYVFILIDLTELMKTGFSFNSSTPHTSS